MSKKFEELLQELNSIVKELESGTLDLEESIEKYKKGMEISKLCKQRLEEAKEVIVKKMNESMEHEESNE
ncbi:MAG TPA: exodeoxyribonuclease VII small subunit [Bacilli bacterium]|nr:exodeoxyribonuclease VII small subunit [Bacilli bacterium]HQD91729.1 exodeoxyribonuclease VII small subunit [Bacilli bacterium]